MERWADFVIMSVKHAANAGSIESVGASPDLGDIFGPRATWTKDLVIKAIERGFSFRTAPRGADGKVSKGALIEVVTVHGEKFLRTDRNAVKADNLGALPEF